MTAMLITGAVAAYGWLLYRWCWVNVYPSTHRDWARIAVVPASVMGLGGSGAFLWATVATVTGSDLAGLLVCIAGLVGFALFAIWHDSHRA